MIDRHEADFTYMLFIEIMKLGCLAIALFTTWFMWSDKKLISHPGGLIALIFTFLAGFLQLKDQHWIICKTSSYKLLAKTLYYIGAFSDKDIKEAEYIAFVIQVIGHFFMYELFLMMYLFLCVCFSWDLW
jgi:hypothetical protein